MKNDICYDNIIILNRGILCSAYYLKILFKSWRSLKMQIDNYEFGGFGSI